MWTCVWVCISSTGSGSAATLTRIKRELAVLANQCIFDKTSITECDSAGNCSLFPLLFIYTVCGCRVQIWRSNPFRISRVCNQSLPRLRQTETLQEYRRQSEIERLWLSESWLIVHPTIPREQRRVVWDVTRWAETKITETKEGFGSHYRGDHLRLKSAICSPHRPSDLPNC